MHVVVFPVELDKISLEVGAHVPHDLLAALKDLAGQRSAPALRHEDQMDVERGEIVSAAPVVGIIRHRPGASLGTGQVRYNFRRYPAAGQRAALAKAFGCARVVFNDGLRMREEARAAGLPYIKD